MGKLYIWVKSQIYRCFVGGFPYAAWKICAVVILHSGWNGMGCTYMVTGDEMVIHICGNIFFWILVWLLICRVLEYPVEDTVTEMVGLMCLTCPKMACTGCPKVARAPVKVDKRTNFQSTKKSEPKITVKIKKELIEKKHKKEKKKDKKEKKKEKVVIPSGLVMTCSSCSTVFNSVTGLGEHRRLCKRKWSRDDKNSSFESWHNSFISTNIVVLYTQVFTLSICVKFAFTTHYR